MPSAIASANRTLMRICMRPLSLNPSSSLLPLVTMHAHMRYIDRSHTHSLPPSSPTAYATRTECYVNGHNKYSQRRTPGTVQHAPSNNTAAHHNKKSADSQPNSDTMSSELSKNLRDRLGLWGTTSDSEVAGNVSGLERLRSARFNKVSYKTSENI